MQSFLSSFSIVLVFLFLTFQNLTALNPNDWILYEPDILESYVPKVTKGPDGAIWLASGSKIIRFDGNNWVVYDFEEAGFTTQYPYIRDFDFAPNGHIWCCTYSRVFDLDISSNTWVMHDPSNGAVNLNGFSIAVEDNDRIWYGVGSRLFEYNGTDWNSYNFWNVGDNINPESARKIIIDDDNAKWWTTPHSICIDGGCFTPAGLMYFSDTDTIPYNSELLGHSEARFTTITPNLENKPLVVVGPAPTFYRSFENGVWQPPIDLLIDVGWVYAVFQDNEGNVWFSYKENNNTPPGILRHNIDGSWEYCLFDNVELNYINDIFVDEVGNAWFGGRKNDNTGVLGLLPKENFKGTGTVFFDPNSNGTQEVGEIGFPNGILKALPGPQYAMTSLAGNFTASFPAVGNYGLELQVPDYFNPTIPVSATRNFDISASVPFVENLNFGLNPDLTAQDLAISLTALNGANPGFEVCYLVSYQNLAPQVVSGTFTSTFDELLTLQSTSLPPTSTAGNEFTFAFDNLEWLETRHVEICFLLPPDADLIGVEMAHAGQISTDSGVDDFLENNTYQFTHLITGPYDPNFKEVFPTGETASGIIPYDVPFLEYTIHFQNIGSDTARTVIITDSLDTDLAVETFKMVTASHPYELDLYDNRVLRWTFPQILLPDSSSNEIQSHGFVKFKIAPNVSNSQAIGTVIENNAAIYFDFNPPIRTNTVVNTLSMINALPQNEIPDCPITLNYTSDFLNISMPVNVGTQRLIIYNLQGKMVAQFRFSTTENELFIGDLDSGIYFAFVAGQEHCRQQVVKFVKF